MEGDLRHTLRTCSGHVATAARCRPTYPASRQGSYPTGGDARSARTRRAPPQPPPTHHPTRDTIPLSVAWRRHAVPVRMERGSPAPGFVRRRSCPKSAVRAVPPTLLLLCLLLRGSWLTVEGSRGRRRHSAASPGRTGSRGRVGRRGWRRSEATARRGDFRFRSFGRRRCRRKPGQLVEHTGVAAFSGQAGVGPASAEMPQLVVGRKQPTTAAVVPGLSRLRGGNPRRRMGEGTFVPSPTSLRRSAPRGSLLAGANGNR